jgi:tungstate transport system substrate-binding protein
VRAVAVGTGTAIANAKKGDGDVLMVHSKEDELEFVRRGMEWKE